MLKTISSASAAGLALLLLSVQSRPGFAQASGTSSAQPAAEAKQTSAQPMSDQEKIDLAMKAGPAEITKTAAIVDLTGAEMKHMPDKQPKQLRPGANGWVCFASENQPMCLDKEWQKWAQAWLSKTEPKIEGVGIAYMLLGDKGGSNTDPFAMSPTPDNQWVIAPAHLMLLFPDPKMLDAYPTDPKNGGPWVMFKGTPYAHLMVPVAPDKAASMPGNASMPGK